MPSAPNMDGSASWAYVSNFMQDESKMKIVRDAGVVISIGSDCHRCEEYNGHRLYEAYDFLKKNGFTTYDELI